jgi:RHS repeat-associated protein
MRMRSAAARHPWWFTPTVLVAVASMVASLILALQLASGRGAVPVSQPGSPVPVHVLKGRSVKVPAMRRYHAPPVSWPAAVTATAAFSAAAVPAEAVPRTAGPSAGSARAGNLPIWVGPPDAAAVPKASREPVTTADTTGNGVSRVRVAMSPHAAAAALGVHGVVFSVAPAGGTRGSVHVSLHYSSFADAYGGNYASRLHLVELPVCALTTPKVAACRKQSPVPSGSADNVRTERVGADITFAGTGTTPAARLGQATLTADVSSGLDAPPSGVVVLAATSAMTGSGGNYTVPPLSEMSEWVNGASSGAYTYSYPITVPPVPGGLEPTVALTYNSQMVDGITSATNPQASWVGDGWDSSQGFIEEDYPTCSAFYSSADDTEPLAEINTPDLCAPPQLDEDYLTLSLNGTTTTLVYDNSTAKWHTEADSADKIQQDGSYWVVTDTKGTSYYFGLNQLPGYAAGDQATDSVWTVPVWTTMAGDFLGGGSFQELPWRWNLDYVTDAHGDAIAYFYNTQTNYYAEEEGTTGTGQYAQGGSLARIEYGLRAGDIYGYTPAAQVNFTVASGRQDAPTDLACSAGGACAQDAPTFWNDDALTGISTEALNGASLENVDSWALADEYPATGDSTTPPSLWLSSITRTGQDGSTPITLPPTTFAGTPMPNRVMTSADTAAGYSLMTRLRLTSITNDTGGVTTIAYSSAGCTAGDFPAPDANTTTCYPSYWVPESGSNPGAPGAPSGLTVTATGYTTVSLSWTGSSGTVSGYHVFENGTELSSTGAITASASGTTATVSGLSSSTSYSFTVEAYNSSGASLPSSSVQATTLTPPAAPGAPGTLSGTGCTIASDAETCDVSLSWGAASGTVTGYDIYENGNLNTSVSGTSASIAFAATGNYSFYVEAYNAGGNGPASNTITLTVGKYAKPAVKKAAANGTRTQQSSSSSPVEDWFNTYAVRSVTQTDTTGADPPVVTSYTYASPAWHFDGDTMSRSVTTTWDEWRGYQTVTTESGTAPDPVTEAVDTYFQGMSQDETSSSCPQYPCGSTVTLTSSRGQTATDSYADAGMLFESIVYDGAGTGNEVTDTIYNLAAVTTGTSATMPFGLSSYMVEPTGPITYTTLAGGGTRESTVTDTYDQYGRVTQELDIPDTSNPAESTCTLTSYNTNTTTNVMDQASQVQVITPYDGGCTINSASQAVSSAQYSYDSSGDVTQTQQGTVASVGISTSGPAVPVLNWTYQTSNTSTYDEYGRVLNSTDADHDTTTTSYTPATGAEPTSVQVTDPMGLITTTTYAPARELPLTVTDPSGDVTTTAYDALGRETAEWIPGAPASGPATTTYSYTVSNTSPPVTTEQDLEPDGNYLTIDTIDDSFGNVIEIQQETASGGTDVTDTSYNSDGWKALEAGPYYVVGLPSGTPVEAVSSSVPDQTGYDYDGDGRVIRQISYDDGTETWETDTSYGGDETTVVPPPGGTAETTWTNGEGETTAIWQYHASDPVSVSDPATDYDATTYTYTPGSQLATIKDAGGNVWTYTYDPLGDQLTATDPDAGTTTNTYDADQRLMTVTDARGKTVSYKYDDDGREIAEYDTTSGAPESSSNELASWAYDTVAKGQLTSSTAYENGSQYTEEVTGYASNGQPSGTETIIPAAQGALAGTYSQAYTYAPDGQETSYTDSAAGGLPAETVTLGYNSAGDEDSLTGASTYVDSLSYTNLGQPLQYTMGTSSKPVYITDSYEPATGNLTQQNTQTGTAETQVDDLNYSYNDVGDITSEADTPAGNLTATNVECFQYDYLNRLVQAWAQGSAGCASTPSASAEGGTAPYWDTYSYNVIGNLTGVTSTTASGATTTTTDTYPAAGAAHPHAITGQSVTAPSGSTSSAYSYNADGDLTSVTDASQDQALTWNDAGQLTQDAVTHASGSAQDSSYIYDAGGTLLLEADPGTTTLYLPDEELSLNTTTSAVTGTRYYNLGSQTVATLTTGSTGSTGLAYLAGDQQGTESVALNASTLAVTSRYYDPYGNPIGAAVSGFPDGEKGFVGGVTDNATGLTDLGAREYQSQTGSFISTDPDISPYDPQDLDAYAYGADNPSTFSDPTGENSTSTSGPPPAENTYYNRCTGQSYTAPYDLNTSCGAGGYVAGELQDAITFDLENATESSIQDALALYAADPIACDDNFADCIDTQQASGDVTSSDLQTLQKILAGPTVEPDSASAVSAKQPPADFTGWWLTDSGSETIYFQLDESTLKWITKVISGLTGNFVNIDIINSQGKLIYDWIVETYYIQGSKSNETQELWTAGYFARATYRVNIFWGVPIVTRTSKWWQYEACIGRQDYVGGRPVPPSEGGSYVKCTSVFPGGL